MLVLALVATGGAAALHWGVSASAEPAAAALVHPSVTGPSPDASHTGAGVDCSRGNRTIQLAAASGNMGPAILAAFNTLGAQGGGTIELGSGTFEIAQTLSLQTYSNVAVVGSGPALTILSMPANPVGNFLSLNGTPLGEFNLSRNGPVDGATANMIQLAGSVPIDHFALCDLTLRGEANTAAEAWSGSLLYDGSGGVDHVYADLQETDLFGPGTEPNGLHIAEGPGARVASGYLVDGISASANALPYEVYPGAKGGANFLNVGAVHDSTVENVVGTGQAAFEIAPCSDCRIENWTVRGHLTIDPSTGGSWGGTVFRNLSVNSSGTPASNAVDVMISGASGANAHDFSGVSWTDDAITGTALWGANLVNVTGSTFVGSLNETPANFVDDRVVLTGHGSLPIWVDGLPTGGNSAKLLDDSFDFSAGTNGADAFVEAVPNCVWSHDSFSIDGKSGDALVRLTNGTLSAGSSFEFLNYTAIGIHAAPQLSLIDLATSPTLKNLGASVGHLGNLTDNLPKVQPTAPAGGAPQSPAAPAIVPTPPVREERVIIAPHYVAVPDLWGR